MAKKKSKVTKCVCKPVKLSISRIIASGIAFMIVAMIIHTLGAQLGMGFYTDPAYYGVWSPLMMPPMTSFFYYSALFTFVTGVLFAIVYTIAGCCLPGKNMARRGVNFGIMLFLVAGIPGALSMYLLINLPGMLIWLWTLENLLLYIIGGGIIAEINR